MSAALLPPPCLRCGFAIWAAGRCAVCATTARVPRPRRALPPALAAIKAKHTAVAIVARERGTP